MDEKRSAFTCEKQKEGWAMWEKQLNKRLDNIEHTQGKTNDILLKVYGRVAGLEVKSGIWGVLGGLLAAVAALAMMILKK